MRDTEECKGHVKLVTCEASKPFVNLPSAHLGEAEMEENNLPLRFIVVVVVHKPMRFLRSLRTCVTPGCSDLFYDLDESYMDGCIWPDSYGVFVQEDSVL